MMDADPARLIDDAFPDEKFYDAFELREQTGVVFKPTLVKCKRTGRLFEASNPGFLDLRGLFNEDGAKFYFREVEPVVKGRFFSKIAYRRTGRVWRPRSDEFEVLQ